MENEVITSKDEEKVILYPIAEIFESVQGEGYYVGAPFVFIRMAGCTVGRPDTAYMKSQNLPTYHEICTSFDGKKFICDTNFRKDSAKSLDYIVDLVRTYKVEHVCFTGGEPLMHDIKPLVDALRRLCIKVHIETSGTIAPPWLRAKAYESVWVTVSPKLGYLTDMIYRADELKILVGEDFDQNRIPASFLSKHKIYLQPYEDLLAPGMNKPNVAKCLEILKLHPRWRLSIQMHKVIGVR